MTRALTIAAIALSYSAVCAQSVAFEVASIKAVPMQAARLVPREFRIEPAGLRATATVQRLVAGACSLPEVLVTGGPSWCSSQLHVVSAQSEERASPEEVRRMLRTLLEDRFHLRLHRERRETSYSALVEGQNGIKAQKVRGLMMTGLSVPTMDNYVCLV